MATGSKRLRGKSWQLRVHAASGVYLSRTLGPEGGKPLPAKTADRELRTLIDEAENANPARRGQTVASVLAAYVMAKASKWSAATLVEHKRIIDQRLVPRLGDVPLAVLAREPERIDQAYALLRARLAEASLERTHVVLRAALQLAVKRGWVPFNPADRAERPTAEAIEPTAPSVADVATFLATLDEHDQAMATLVRLDANTGARRGELCALRWSAIDLDRGEVTISRALAAGIVEQSTKTRRTRKVALGPHTLEVVRSWRLAQAERALACGTRLTPGSFVFSTDPPYDKPWWPSSVSRRLRLLRDRHGLPAVTLLALRHFVATTLLDQGESVITTAGRLGHNPSMTHDVYGARVTASDQRAADLLDSLLG